MAVDADEEWSTCDEEEGEGQDGGDDQGDADMDEAS